MHQPAPPMSVSSRNSTFGVKAPTSRRGSVIIGDSIEGVGGSEAADDERLMRSQINHYEEASDYPAALRLRYELLERLAGRRREATQAVATFGGRKDMQRLANICEVLLNDGDEYIRRVNFYALMRINARDFKEANRLLQHATLFVSPTVACRPINIFFDEGVAEGSREAIESSRVLHRAKATVENNLGLCAFKAGRLHDAEVHFFACAAMEEQLGDDADNPAATLFNLSQVQSALGKGKTAVDCAEAAAAHLRPKLEDKRLLLVQQGEVRQLLLHVLFLKASEEKGLKRWAKAIETYKDAVSVAATDHHPQEGAEMVTYAETLLAQCRLMASKDSLRPRPISAARGKTGANLRSRLSSARPQSATTREVVGAGLLNRVRPSIVRPNSASAATPSRASYNGKPLTHYNDEQRSDTNAGIPLTSPRSGKVISNELAPYYRRERIVTNFTSPSSFGDSVPRKSAFSSTQRSAIGAEYEALLGADFRPASPASAVATQGPQYDNIQWNPASEVAPSSADVVSRTASGALKPPLPTTFRASSVSFVDRAGEGGALSENSSATPNNNSLKIPTRPTTAPRHRPLSASSSRSGIPGVPHLRDSPTDAPLLVNEDMPTSEHFEPIVSDECEWTTKQSVGEKTATEAQSVSEELLLMAAKRLGEQPLSTDFQLTAPLGNRAQLFADSPGLKGIYNGLPTRYRRAFDRLATLPSSPMAVSSSSRARSNQPHISSAPTPPLHQSMPATANGNRLVVSAARANSTDILSHSTGSKSNALRPNDNSKIHRTEKRIENTSANVKSFPKTLPKFSSIVVFSAHWEEKVPTITSGASHDLFYDYYGFPKEAYSLKYPAPGNPELAGKIGALLQQAGIASKMEPKRGWDHGVFIPLMLMYPEANIPIVEVSLVSGLDPDLHIRIGRALEPLLDDDVLILGSGFTFHNMQAFFGPESERRGPNEAFEAWLKETCADPRLTEEQRTERLVNWNKAPGARYCHPREEHLIPLHVCYGAGGGGAGQQVYEGNVMAKTSGYLW